MAAKIFIQAQKYRDGYGWMPCESHQATMWAAYSGARLLGRYPQKHKAAEVVESHMKRQLGLARYYQLGGRMQQQPDGVGNIAMSLTKEQFTKSTKG